MEIGSIVKANAGKEKGEIFVVVAIENNFVYLADGKRLRANKPKKKSLKHVKLFGNEKMDPKIVLDTNERVNAGIRKFLSQKRSEYV